MRAEGCYHHPLLPLNTTVSSLINHSLKEALYCTDIFTGTDGAFTDLFRVSANTCMCTFICACSELDKHQSRQMHTNSSISYCIICDSLLSLCLLSVNVNGVVMSVWFTDINVRRDLLIPANLSVKLKHSSWAEPRLRCLIRTIVKISVFLYFEKCEVLIMHSNDSSWLILKKKKNKLQNQKREYRHQLNHFLRQSWCLKASCLCLHLFEVKHCPSLGRTADMR